MHHQTRNSGQNFRDRIGYRFFHRKLHAEDLGAGLLVFRGRRGRVRIEVAETGSENRCPGHAGRTQTGFNIYFYFTFDGPNSAKQRGAHVEKMSTDERMTSLINVQRQQHSHPHCSPNSVVAFLSAKQL